jgi:hypothetical protein
MLPASCRKRRSFCTGCGARRVAQTASHLAEHIISHVSLRQQLLPFASTAAPAAGRAARAGHAGATTDAAGSHAPSGDVRLPHGVTPIQRIGSGVNLNIHLHRLVLDGVYRCGADDVPDFAEAGPLTFDGLHGLLQFNAPGGFETARLETPWREAAAHRLMSPLESQSTTVFGRFADDPQHPSTAIRRCR